jgi:hypothetical protein
MRFDFSSAVQDGTIKGLVELPAGADFSPERHSIHTSQQNQSRGIPKARTSSRRDYQGAAAPHEAQRTQQR